jgi:hypothetical protein
MRRHEAEREVGEPTFASDKAHGSLLFRFFHVNQFLPLICEVSMKLPTQRIPCASLSLPACLLLVATAGLLAPGAPQASAQEFSHAAVKTAKPIKQTHVLNPSSIPPGLRQGRSLSAQTVPVRTNLTPVNTGTGVVFTCDPNVAAATCNYLNSTVAGNLNGTFTNANANIYVQYGATGLGSSTQYFNYVTYDQYVAALNANTNKSAIQKSALSALSTYDAGPYGASNVEVSSALGTNLGFTGMLGIEVNEAACTPGTAACYNALVTVTNDPNIPLYYDNLGGTEPADAYDFYEVVAHEADEALGTVSCISTGNPNGLSDSCGTGVPSAVDLFRYLGAGDLVLDSTLSAVPGAYFSYDGGSTNGANGRAGTPKVYNTLAGGGDYADFLSSEPDCGTNEAVQDAAACPGESQGLSILNDGGGELHILSALGYDTPALVSNFTITVIPPVETIRRGNVAGFILQLKSVNGFNGSVALSCSGGPAGSSCIDFPMKVNVHGTAYAVSGMLFPKNTNPGTYVVTFTGVSGSLTHTATAKVTVIK